MPRTKKTVGSRKRRKKTDEKLPVISKFEVEGQLIPFVDISALIREIGAQVEDGQKETFLNRAIFNAWRKAANGNGRSLLAMLEYGFGKPATAQKDSLADYFRAKIRDAGLSKEQISSNPLLKVIATMVGYNSETEGKEIKQLPKPKENGGVHPEE